jgi:hypothetical protein
VKRWLAVFSSRWTTVVLFLGGFLPYLAYLVFAGRESVTLVAGVEVLTGGVDIPVLIARSFWAKAYFILFLLQLIGRFWTSFARELALPSLEEIDADHIVAASRFYTVVKPYVSWRDKVNSFFKRGFLKVERGQKIAFLRRPLPHFKRAWQLGLLLVLFSFFISFISREAGILRLGEGEVVQRAALLETYRYDWEFPEKEKALSLPFEAIILNEVEPHLDKNLQPSGGFLIERPITAHLSYLSPKGESSFKVGVYPPALISGSFFLVSEFGLGPRLIIEEKGQPLVDTYFKTEISPGRRSSDQIDLADFPFRITLTLVERKPIDLRKAAYQFILVGEKGEKLAEGIVSPQSFLKFGHYRFFIPETRYWVGLSIVKDKGFPLFFFGLSLFTIFFLIHIGLVLFYGREKFLFVLEGRGRDKRLYLGVEASFWSRSRAEKRFRSLVKELEEG